MEMGAAHVTAGSEAGSGGVANAAGSGATGSRSTAFDVMGCTVSGFVSAAAICCLVLS